MKDAVIEFAAAQLGLDSLDSLDNVVLFAHPAGSYDGLNFYIVVYNHPDGYGAQAAYVCTDPWMLMGADDVKDAAKFVRSEAPSE